MVVVWAVEVDVCDLCRREGDEQKDLQLPDARRGRIHLHGATRVVYFVLVEMPWCIHPVVKARYKVSFYVRFRDDAFAILVAMPIGIMTRPETNMHATGR